jgi:hypothetical protein
MPYTTSAASGLYTPSAASVPYTEPPLETSVSTTPGPRHNLYRPE